MKEKKSQRGASLLELITAIVVIGIAVAGFSTVIYTNLELIAEHSQEPEKHLHKYRSCAETILSETQGRVNDCNDDIYESCELSDSEIDHDKNGKSCEVSIGPFVLGLESN